MTPTLLATWQHGAASSAADNAILLYEGDQMKSWHADLPGTSPRRHVHFWTYRSIDEHVRALKTSPTLFLPSQEVSAGSLFPVEGQGFSCSSIRLFLVEGRSFQVSSMGVFLFEKELLIMLQTPYFFTLKTPL